jgi:hypothetical protein
MSTLADHAMEYSDRGWSIVPIGADKVAVGKWRAAQTARPSAAELVRRVSRPGVTGLAAMGGAVSGGLALRDFDRAESYRTWAENHAKLAIGLPTVRTHRGFHVYFRAAEEGYAEFDDGEFRGDSKHYTVLPPSKHPSGKPYAWNIPLPKGELPLIDPAEVGLIPDEAEDATQEHTRAHSNCLSVLSNPECSMCSCVASLHDAIEQTLPPGVGNRNRYIFRFARLLKGMEAYHRLLPTDPLLIDALKQWHNAALPNLATQDWEASWDDFAYCWPRVKVAAGNGVKSILAGAVGVKLPAWAAEMSDASRSLINALIGLQRNAGKKPFFLGCRDAGRIAGLDHVDAARRLRRFVHDGILELVAVGVRPKASSYRYTGRMSTTETRGGPDATIGPSEPSTPRTGSKRKGDR